MAGEVYGGIDGFSGDVDIHQLPVSEADRSLAEHGVHTAYDLTSVPGMGKMGLIFLFFEWKGKHHTITDYEKNLN